MKTSAIIFLAALGFVSPAVRAADIAVETDNTLMLLKTVPGDTLKFVYYGPQLSETDRRALLDDRDPELVNYGYPVFGTADGAPYAMQASHADGGQTLDLAVAGVTRGDDGSVSIDMRDRRYPFRVGLHYRPDRANDIIETWAEVSHSEDGPVTLHRFDSSFLPVEQGDVWVSRMHGDWASEAFLLEEPLKPGMLQIKTTDGARNSHYARPEVMISLDGEPREESGRVIGAALEWSGNFSLRFDTESRRVHRFFAGALAEPAGYVLAPDSTLVLPRVAYSFSRQGKGGVSRNFHRWARAGKVHGCDTPRDILLNSWEGVYLDIKEPVIEKMMKDWADLGGELFVLDDGWFGGKYPRNVDNSSLGDWRTDTRKLPHGIDGLIRSAHRNGLRFGLWVEPEFTNDPSELFEQHPDWVLRADGRPLRYGRGGTQLLLDMTNPQVRDFAFGVIDSLLTAHPGIDYLKWDCNTFMLNYGSSSLPADRQANVQLDYHCGLLDVLGRVRAKYPRTVIQNCGGGGGRYNYGLMPYFDEFWPSDNTDAWQRLFIQWGASMFYPTTVTAQHVNASPSHQTGRIVPMKFRFDVAMTGRLGLEMLPSAMSDEEWAFVRAGIETYKQLRPLMQRAELYRLLSPYGPSGMASLAFVTPDASDALFFAYKVRHRQNQVIPRFRLAGLDPDALYTVTELNIWPGKSPRKISGQTYSGAFLMDSGLKIDMPSEYSSAVFRISRAVGE